MVFHSHLFMAYHAGQPPSRPCLRQDTDLNSQFAGIEAIKSNKTVPAVKPLRDGPYLWPMLSYILILALSSLVLHNEGKNNIRT
jgi:hypothetical protein